MERFYILDDENLKSMRDYLSTVKYTVKEDLILTDEFEFELDKKYVSLLTTLKSSSEYSDPLIYGKDSTLGVTAIEIMDDELWLFKRDGTIEKRPHYFWVMSTRPLDSHFERLDGNQHYKYIRYFTTKNAYYAFLKHAENRKYDVFTIYNSKEAAMVLNGITSYKGMTLDDLGILAFDIESAGLTQDSKSNVFLITNVFKKNGVITEKHFRLDRFENTGAMIDEWCNWVQSVNPDIITGHNINGYDLPYLHHVAKLYGTTLKLGKDISEPFFSTKESQYRVDGTQSWTYKRIGIFGRQIIDGMFLAVKYDIGRKYSSWGLKQIAQAEGLVKEDRQFYDASLIAKNWKDPIEREKIVQYGLDDAMDSLKLFELMIPAYFYSSMSIPKPFQSIIEGASGSWINSILIRGYLQEDHSIPKATELTAHVEGGISFAVPGVYRNLFKVDLKSAYPSQILRFQLSDKHKDPKSYFYKLVKFFTEQRFEMKRLGKETGLRLYQDRDAANKIFINSAYGACNTPGLNFNSPEIAAIITLETRKVIDLALIWASGKNKEYWISEFKKKTGRDEND